MTNGMIEVEEYPADELAFWGLEAPAEEMALRDAAPAPAYDLEDRTARFGEMIIRFAKKISRSPVNNRLIDQLSWRGHQRGRELLRSR